MKVILISGPPRSGKDTFAKYNFKRRQNTVFERFSAPLKTSFAAISNKSYNEFFEVDYYENHKEEPISWLNNVSFRQYQINLSEKHFKPLYGEEVFGNLFVKRLERVPNDSVILVPDSGFDVEINVLKKALPIEDLLLVRTHREGYDFKGDSRSYIYSQDIFSIDLSNNGTQTEFEIKSLNILDELLSPNRGFLRCGEYY